MADSTLPALPAATTLDGTELIYVVQGGADRKVTVDGLGVSRADFDAHVDETDPFVHTADHVESSSTVGQGDVESDLNYLDANKADAADVGTMVSSSVSTVNRNTTTAEEDLISFTLPANTLDSDGDLLIIEANGDILANSGSPTFTWKLKNGLIVIDTPAAAMATSASLRRWKLRATIQRTTVTAQAGAAILNISQAIATTTWNLADPAHNWVGNIANITDTDFAVASTVKFTVQMSVSNANNRVRMYGYSAHKVAA